MIFNESVANGGDWCSAKRKKSKNVKNMLNLRLEWFKIFENMDIGLSGTKKHTSLHASQKFLCKYLLKRRKPNINSFTYNATDLQ